MKIQIKNNVSWVGKTDWELRKFHGDEYSTHRGTTYNSYLIQEDKIALIDTVWKPFASEFIHNLQKEVDLQKIDYIIVNHGEIDHSGALPELLSIIPDKPLYCTENAVKSLKGHYHKDWNFNTVKTGDKLSLGSKELIFIQAPMLHWPDTMFSYLTGDNILFSNDAFGQHYCSESLFNDTVDQSALYEEAIKYYANILSPFNTMVIRKIEEFFSLKLPLDIICTSHGTIWRTDPMQIINKYLEWANDYKEEQVTVIYDTMWNGTRMLAENIAKGILSAGTPLNVKLYNSSNSDINDIITEVFKSKAILIGSPTVNKGILHSIAACLELIKSLRFKNKKASAFGCYGWNCESAEQITAYLKNCGYEIISDVFKANWMPDEDALANAREYGKHFALKI